MGAKVVGQSVNDTAKLWRYFSLPKLLHLLQTKALYFSRVDKFNDPFEGYPTTRESRLAANTLVDPVLKVQSRLIRKCTYASCWSQYDVENAAMWTTYGTAEGGVLVQTTFGKLASLLPSSVYLGKVRYISDNDNDLPVTAQNPEERMSRKLDYFVHEREVRAIKFDEDTLIDQEGDTGKTVPIDLVKLVETIIIQPTAPEWIHLTIEQLLEKYGVSFQVKQSALRVIRGRR